MLTANYLDINLHADLSSLGNHRSASLLWGILPNIKIKNRVRSGRDQEKSSSRKKFKSPKKSNFFPQIFFWFIWKQRCYSNGRPLILKLVPNDEE